MKTFLTLLVILTSYFANCQRFVMENFSSGLASWTPNDSRVSTTNTSPSTGYSSPIAASGGNNVIFQNCNGIGATVSLTSPSYDFTGKTGIIIGFGHRKTTAGIPLELTYSIGGGAPVTITTVSGTTTWGFNDYPLSALDGQSGVTFTFSFVTTTNANCTASPNNRIDDFAIGENMSLPVTFSNFSANSTKDASHLYFSTASETNNDYFTIERSADGRSFDAIGEIKGAGNSNTTIYYEYTDEKPYSGINFYRIKQTDYDGKCSYSDIISVRHNTVGNLSITPRTTEGRLQVTTDIEAYSLDVYNVAGQQVKAFKSLSKDQYISIDDLTAGLYFIKVNHDGQVETTKIVKI